MFFRLLPEVYLITGKSKSLLQNILDKKYLWIHNDLAQIIKGCEENKPIPENFKDILSILVQKKWGTLSEKPIFVDKFRLTNIFNEKKFFKDVPYIHSAVLKLTNVCSLSCDSCYSAFCPVCFKSKNNVKDVLSINEWKNIVIELKKFGCKSILLTGGESTLYPHLRDLYNFILGLDILPTICTNGLHTLNNYDNNQTHIIIPAFNLLNMFTIISNFKKYKKVTLIFCCELNDKIKRILPQSWRYINSSIHYPKIHRDKLANMDVFNFFERKDKNQCLNGKIAILENGDVYPCLGACTSKVDIKSNCLSYYNLDEDVLETRKIGNVKNDLWSDIIKKLMKNFWSHKIDNNPKCHGCEFRYTCKSCLFNDVIKNCTYNVEEAVWK